MQDKNNIISAIKAKRASMSKSHKKIADFICEHYDKAAFMTASKLGKTVGVSESTVVRFADIFMKVKVLQLPVLYAHILKIII